MPTNNSRKIKLGRTYKICFVPGSDLIVTLGRTLRLWGDCGTEQVAEAKPFANPGSMALSPDGCSIAVKGTSGRIALLAMPGLELIRQLASSVAEEGSNLLFSPCGQFLVDGTWSGRLVVRSVSTGEIHLDERTPNAMHPLFDQSDDRRTFVYVRQPKAVSDDPPPPSLVLVRNWPFVDHEEAPIPGDWGSVQAVALSPDARRVAVLQVVLEDGRAQMRVKVTDLEGQHAVQSGLFPLAGTNLSITWSPDAMLIGCVLKGRVCLMDAASLKELGNHEDSYPCFVGFSPDGKRLGLGSWKQGTVLPTSEVLERPSTNHPASNGPRKSTRAAKAPSSGVDGLMSQKKIAVFYDATTAEILHEAVTGTPDELTAWMTDYTRGKGLIFLYIGAEAEVADALAALEPHLTKRIEQDRGKLAANK
jgi:WD40 repeat protein